MMRLPTLPQRSWLERTSLILASGLVIGGLLTLVAWWLGLSEVLQPFGERAALKFNAALGFMIIGVVMLAIDLGSRRWIWLAVAPLAISVLTLLEHGLGRSFGLDELFVRDYLLTDTEIGGRMAIPVALGLLLCSAVLLWRLDGRGTPRRLFTEAVTGSVLAAGGVSTLLAHAAGLGSVIHFGAASATSPAAAIALLLSGVALALLAWREGVRQEGETPSWAPIPAVIGGLALTLMLWAGLRDRETAGARQRTQAATDALASEIKAQFDLQINRFERLARRRSALAGASVESWRAEVSREFEDLAPIGCVLIADLDPQRVARWVHPGASYPGAVNFDHGRDAARAGALTIAGRPPFNAMVSGSTAVNLPGIGSRSGLVFYAAVTQQEQVTGYVAGEFDYQRFFAAVAGARRRAGAEFHATIALSPAGEVLYRSPGTADGGGSDASYDRTYVIADRRLRLTVHPSPASVLEDRSYLPELALGAGVGITLLLGLSVHLARSARAGQRSAELSNRRLFSENEERRRVEARLKVSDERLRLALDSTQIGIFEWNIPAGHVYYSPGLWAMLGYDHARMPSTVEVWQTLIHPDDLPLYRRRIESQLNGSTSFIEPEHRVRARHGEWRWVYTRAKAVSSGPDGRPLRVIGTVQDITARREAEIALRESQAEARKLSLVAAKTDNPVLIISADGRIEWANEAFCRVMEYSLEEVIGRSPAQFMVGPETNPRSVASIRAALARGQGLSTDVVNYSKSGRKYHLHIEVQPVRGASGEVENFIAVETDITARVESENQLRRAKQEADEASRAKSDFLASMSHEIRTPMNGVTGMTSLLLDTPLTPEQRDYVTTIRTSGDALLTVINDILDFSKIESGKMELERTPFELALCIEDALDLFALQASAKRIELGYQMAPDVPAWVVSDMTRLRQVIVNLVNNAVKFTPGGSISVEVRRLAREAPASGFGDPAGLGGGRLLLEFAVRDTGIGIPGDRLDRLFKAFSQVDSSTTRKYGGTGLGLAICQRLCALMGGTIRVESRPGEGSAFIFTVLTEPAPEATAGTLPPLPHPLREGWILGLEGHPVPQARLRSLLEKWGARIVFAADAEAAGRMLAAEGREPALLIISTREDAAVSPWELLRALPCPRLVLYPFGRAAPVPPPEARHFATATKPLRTGALLHTIGTLLQPGSRGEAPLPKAQELLIGEEIPLQVLLAEDNVVNQKVALRFLERLGYRADAVANGTEAVAAARARRYDLVLMDLQMPEMDGFEATRLMRTSLPADRQPRIIALTANAMQGDRELCLAAGMDDHLPKPVKMQDIAAAIRRHFSARLKRSADSGQPV